MEVLSYVLFTEALSYIERVTREFNYAPGYLHIFNFAFWSNMNEIDYWSVISLKYPIK